MATGEGDWAALGTALSPAEVRAVESAKSKRAEMAVVNALLADQYGLNRNICVPFVTCHAPAVKRGSNAGVLP